MREDIPQQNSRKQGAYSMTRVLQLQRLPLNGNPMSFDPVFMSGISSVCPTTNQPDTGIFEME
jgi:hypothetical protein